MEHDSYGQAFCQVYHAPLICSSSAASMIPSATPDCSVTLTVQLSAFAIKGFTGMWAPVGQHSAFIQILVDRMFNKVLMIEPRETDLIQRLIC